MKSTQISAIMGFLASLCFFISFITGGQVLNLILGGVWLLISGINLLRLFKERNKNEK